MNKVCLIGRLTAKPELRYTSSNVPVIRFNVAVNRQVKNESGEREADFIGCVAFNKSAELISNYFDKGSQIGIEGRIQTGSYEDKDGKKIYTTDVIVENITFLNKKEETQNATQQATEVDSDPFADFGQQVEIDSYLD